MCSSKSYRAMLLQEQHSDSPAAGHPGWGDHTAGVIATGRGWRSGRRLGRRSDHGCRWQQSNDVGLVADCSNARNIQTILTSPRKRMAVAILARHGGLTLLPLKQVAPFPRPTRASHYC